MSIDLAVTELEKIVNDALPSTYIQWENRSKVPPANVIYVAPRVLPGAVTPFSLGFYNAAGVWSSQELTLEVRIITPEGKGTKTAYSIAETLTQAARAAATITMDGRNCLHLISPSSLIVLGQDDTNSHVMIHNTLYRYSRRG